MTNLPPFCLISNSDQKAATPAPALLLIRGRSGYNAVYSLVNVDLANQELGITKAQVSAMYIGSMFGWDNPGADPDSYGEEGNPK